jgi:hypothetical protein
MKKIIIILLFSVTASGAVFINSFNSGQLSPKMKNRIDTDRRNMGVETLENILVRPQGMAYRRPGTEFIEAVDTETVRFIPFEYSNDDSYVLMFYDDVNEVVEEVQ